MNKALILDRDGIIVKETGKYIKDISEIEFVPDIVPVLRELAAEYLLFIVTNQGGIWLGQTQHSEYIKMELYIKETLQNNGIVIQETFYCPHHPSVCECLCRKPSPLWVERIIHKWKVSPYYSWFVGDMFRDIKCGLMCGLNTIMVPSNTPASVWYSLLKAE